jgi:hypothetical protein
MSSWYPNRLDAFVGNFVERFAQLLSADYQVSVIHTHGDAACTKIEEEITEENGVHTARTGCVIGSGSEKRSAAR